MTAPKTKNRVIDNVIEIVQDMDWGVMDNSIDAKELLKKLDELKNEFYCHDEDIGGKSRCVNQCQGCKECF